MANIVEIAGSRVTLPPVCVMCGVSPSTEEFKSKLLGPLPVCAPCVASRKKDLAAGTALATSMVVLMVGLLVMLGLGAPFMGWLALAACLPLLAGVRLLRRAWRWNSALERLHDSSTSLVFRARSLPYAQALAAANHARVEQVAIYTGPRDQRSDALEKRHSGKAALSREVLAANDGDGNTRMNVALGAVVGTSVIGALVMRDHGRTLLEPLVFLASAGGALGGALFHPIRRYWRKGLACGVLVNLGGMAATYFYMLPRTTVWNYELIIPLGLGGAPGALLYWLLMRREVVGSPRKDGARAGGGGTPTAVP